MTRTALSPWLVLTACGLLLPGYVARNVLLPWRTGGQDIGVDYCAARVAARAGNIYDARELRIERDASGADMDRGGYIKPPLFAVLMAPMGGLTPVAARRVWVLLSHACVVGIIAFLAASLFEQPRERGAAAIALPLLALSSQPLSSHFLAGQTNLLVMLLIVTALWSLHAGRPVAVGVALGTAAALKLYPLTLIAYFLWKRRYRVVVSAGIAVLAWTCVTVCVLGFRTHLDFVARVLPTLLHYRSDVSHYSNQSIYACFYRLFVDNLYTDAVINSPIRARLVSSLCCAVLVAITVILCKSRSTGLNVEISLVVVATTLITSQAWDMNFVAMLLPAAVLIRETAHQPAQRRLPQAAVLVFALVLLNARFGVWQTSDGSVRTFMLLCPRLLVALTLYVLLARRVGDAGSRPQHGDGQTAPSPRTTN